MRTRQLVAVVRICEANPAEGSRLRETAVSRPKIRMKDENRLPLNVTASLHGSGKFNSGNDRIVIVLSFNYSEKSNNLKD